MNDRTIFERYFNGETNFMTPNVVGYSHKWFGSEKLVVEFSQGRGLFDTYLFGVSCLVFDPTTCKAQKIELSEAFKDSKSGHDYFESISKADFENAMRYGEEKVL